MGIIEAIVAIVAVSAIGGVGAGAVGLSLVGTAIVASVVYGGNAISKSLASKKESFSNSPTYQFNTLQTQTNNQLPVPLIYGENKIAGNRIWQQTRNENTIIERIVAFGEGPIEGIFDLRLNDLPIAEVTDVSYRLYTGLFGQIVDTIVPGDLNTRIKTVGSLKNLAYVALSIKASEKIRGDYNLTALVKGRKVRVYTTCDSYTVKYSNNPAWCLLDFLTSYNGCGIGLSATGERDDAIIKEFIDINSFIEAAQFCDTPVNGSPRFAFNMIIDSQAERREIIEEFKKACRGALTIKGKHLQLKIDMPQDTIKVIDSKDIIAGTEQFYTISKEENFDRMVVKYRAKNQEWAICEAIAEKPQYDNVPSIEHSVNIYSVTDHNQASRLAWYYLNKVAQERAFGYFETDYRAFDLEIGDVIELSDNLMKFERKKVKITKLIDKNDATFGVSWREYNELVYSDEIGSIEPVMALCALNDNYVNPPSVENFCATIMMGSINLSWQAFQDSSITYEIRLGDSWESAQLVASNISSNTLFVPISAIGIKKYLIKAKSKYNFYSKAETVAMLYIESIPSVNVMLTQDFLNTKNATLNGCKLYNNVLKPTPSGFWAKFMPKIPQAPYANSSGLWSQMTAQSESSFVTQIFDIKGNYTSILSLSAQFAKKSDAQSFLTYIKTSADNAFWSDWKEFLDGCYDFRYYQIKFVVKNPLKEPWALLQASISIDVPDRDETYKNIPITDTQNGTTIAFSTHEQSKIKTDFIETPTIVANLTGSNVGYCVITQKSPKSLTIRAYNSANTAIAATCDIHVKGY